MEWFTHIIFLWCVSVGLNHSLNALDISTDRHLRQKRTITAAEKKYWDNGIVPYVFMDDLPSEKRRNYVQTVFPVFEKYSCIRFVPWKDNTQSKYNLGHNNYLKFNNMKQCQSMLGNTRKTGQGITCCFGKTCLHELGHALGLYHEHSNPLRGDHIRVNYENIKDGLGSAFREQNGVNTFGIYDYDSIMHYAVKAWSRNNKPTITFLDPDVKPASSVADRERYFYLFMQINAAYKCTDHCGLQCENGGYQAIVDGACACRCPEGLDPSSNCKKLLKADSNCGEIISLDNGYLSHKLLSPKLSKKKTSTCYWFVKSPAGSRILLDFPVFKVRQQKGECRDEVAVRHYLPGLYGRQYCGSMFKKTVISTHNELAFSFTQTPYSKGPASQFVASLYFVHDEDFCYNTSNKGEHYNGHVSFGDESSQCLYWDRVTNCRHNLFNVRDSDANLEANYCRNPDGSNRPWCYTNIEGCQRTYCDACQLGTCRNVASNCKSRISNDPKYCKTDVQAPTECREQCGFCDRFSHLPSVASTSCQRPTLPPDARIQTLADNYPVGSTLQVECDSGTEYRNITCLSDGQWTPLNFVCGTCKPGWTAYGSTCYKLFTFNKKKHLADDFCEAECDGCSLVKITNGKTNTFITDLITQETDHCEPIWLGVSKAEEGNVYELDDGTPLNWNKWADDGQTPTGGKCVVMNMFCVWKDKSCSSGNQFVCEYQKKDPFVCADQRNDCNYILKRNPEFCKQEQKAFASTFCPKTCGLCM